MSTRRTPEEVLQFARDNEARMLDVRFADLPGLWQHVTFPIAQLKETTFEDGFGFDGSSIRGWQAISESDMLIVPDPNTAMMDPFTDVPTLVMIADIVDPVTKQHYERDPRWIARKAEQYLQYTDIGDTAFFGPEAEFFIFDNISFDQSHNYGFYYIDAEEGRWNSSRKRDNLGYRPRYKEGYFPVPPTDHHQNIRTEMVTTMQDCGLEIECHHHEVATGGQGEIDQKYDSLVKRGPDSFDDFTSNVCAQRCISSRAHCHFHAEAAMERQRQRHARAPEPLERRGAAFRRRSVRRVERHGALLHRRPAQARPGVGCLRRADDEQL